MTHLKETESFNISSLFCCFWIFFHLYFSPQITVVIKKRKKRKEKKQNMQVGEKAKPC